MEPSGILGPITILLAVVVDDCVLWSPASLFRNHDWRRAERLHANHWRGTQIRYESRSWGRYLPNDAKLLIRFPNAVKVKANKFFWMCSFMTIRFLPHPQSLLSASDATAATQQMTVFPETSSRYLQWKKKCWKLSHSQPHLLWAFEGPKNSRWLLHIRWTKDLEEKSRRDSRKKCANF